MTSFWKALKPRDYNVIGNDGRECLKTSWMKQWVISSQASWEQVEGSEIRVWNPNAVMVMDGKTPRVRGIHFYRNGW